MLNSPERRWQAVVERDPDFDGNFVYAVRTTGVYCRPSCAARRARRENVAFHDSPAEAERAGFRPCQRCRPNETAARHAATVEAACRRIKAADEPPSLVTLAEAAGMSPHHFHRTFKALTGVTPKAYADARRAERAQRELEAGRSVSETVYEAGFGSSGRFYAAADAMLGMAPRAYRHGGAEVEIRYAVGESTLSPLLVAQSERGVCAILLGDDPNALADDLRARFPKARLVLGNADFAEVVSQVVALVDDPARGLDLPLDVRGTAFQRRVWEALRAVPAGATANYAEIARAIGDPGSARAVAGACAANPLAVAIPCHRVVRSDGELSGYRWGVERKRDLLRREAARR